MSIFEQYRSFAESVIQDAGETVTVYRESSSTTNRYGTPETTLSEVGTATVVLYWGTRSNRAERIDTSAGHFVERRPRVAFALGAGIEQDDLLAFPGNALRVRVDATTTMPTHIEAECHIETDVVA